MKKYGEKIVYYRKKKGLSQSQLAKQLNYRRQTISRWENGITEPDIDNIVKLCKILDVSPDEFLLGEKKETETKVDNPTNGDVVVSNDEQQTDEQQTDEQQTDEQQTDDELCESNLDDNKENENMKKTNQQKEVLGTPEAKTNIYPNVKRPKSIWNKPLWITLSSVFTVLLVAVIVGGIYAFSFPKTINDYFGLSMYYTEEVETDEDIDTEYFKSSFIKQDVNGNDIYDRDALKAKTKEVALQEQREGTTILWNKEDTLPLGKKNVSLFGAGAYGYAYSGTGSGIAESGGMSMFDAFQQAGMNVNKSLWDVLASKTNYYSKLSNNMLAKSGSEIPWSEMNAASSSYSSYSDAAIYVVTRYSGEVGWGNDLRTTGVGTIDGDFFSLYEKEKQALQELVALRNAGTFKKLVVLLNTAEGIGFKHLMEFEPSIDACLWIGQGGKFGIEEVGRILTGDSTPSGHLVDTFVMSGLSAPSSINHEFDTYKNLSSKDWGSEDGDYSGAGRGYFMSHYTIYAENIYVGYKYYETRYEDAVLGQGNANSNKGAVCSNDGWKYTEEVAFPFGYGESYTKFEYETPSFVDNKDGSYTVNVKVNNVGEKPGQDVVQVYVQRPYTDYDKQYKIEQSSVNLCGFSKTKEIAPGGSDTVSITVKADAFKTYDAFNKKTYIREAGDYYLSVGEDAHAAVNNILASKGKTVGDGMTSDGYSSLTKKITFTKDDYETFSKSSTGATITNRFDSSDWNTYEYKDDTNIDYLSRNHWDTTYPKEIQLTVNEQMYDDLDWDKDYEANPNDKMPKYGEQNGLVLIDLRGKKYDDPSWDALLNETTLEEQIGLLSKCAYGTPSIASIAKPGERVYDGPLGAYRAFTSTVLLAASYNENLAEEVGDLMGEYALQNKIGGLYAPGANLHRSMYGGRGYEYYSEDTYVSSRMLAKQVRGIQSTGTYVNVKHFVLNDQDSARKGISTWTNEQALREIYLEVFRDAVEEEGCKGVMTGFNRIGTKWCGALSALNNGVLREEWGFDGFVISDCPWQVYMGTVDGLFGGNDCILYEKVDQSQYEKAKTNATIALKIREATKRILYVVVNSNAMNGYSSNTRIIPITSWWWSNTIIGLIAGLSVAAPLSIIMLILTFIFRKKYKKQCAAYSITTKKYDAYWKANIYVKPAPVKVFKWFIPKKIFVTITSLLLVAVMAGTGYLVYFTISETAAASHKCNHVCLICGGCTSNCEERNCSTKCPGNHTIADIHGETYTFEAEDAWLNEITTDGKSMVGVGKEKNDTTSPNGDGYIYNLSQSVSGTAVTFKIKADAKCAAGLIMRMGHSGKERNLSDLFAISVNGKKFSPKTAVIFGAYDEATEIQYYAWRDTEVGILTLKEGYNTITFQKTITGLNFDAIKLVSQSPLDWSKNSCTEHVYDKYSVKKEPTLTQEGSLIAHCSICATSKEEVLPKLSEENGYTKNVILEPTITTEGKAEWIYTIGEQTFTFYSSIDRLPDTTPKTPYVFEAEDAALYSINGKASIKEATSASGGKYIDGMSNEENGASLTFRINAEDDCLVNINVRSIKHYAQSRGFDDYFTTKINGVTVKTNLIIEPNTNEADKATIWTTFYDFKLLSGVQLKKGENTITFVKCGLVLNLDSITIDSTKKLEWYKADFKTLKIEAEDTTLGGNARVAAEENSNNPSGGKYLGGLSTQVGTSSFVVTSPKDTTASFIMCYGNRTTDTTTRKFSDKFTLTVNDVSASSNVVFNVATENNYFDWEEYTICTVNLKEGDNTFVLASTGVTSSNVDYFKIVSEEELTFKKA